MTHLAGLQQRGRGEHGDHGVIDPNVDGPELALDGLGGTLYGGGVSDIQRQWKGPCAQGLDLGAGHLQGPGVARDQCHRGAMARELERDGATDAGTAPVTTTTRALRISSTPAVCTGDLCS